jgi:hypothetical protein
MFEDIKRIIKSVIRRRTDKYNDQMKKDKWTNNDPATTTLRLQIEQHDCATLE